MCIRDRDLTADQESALREVIDKHYTIAVSYTHLEYDKVDKIRGMDICICTTARTDEEAKELLKLIGAPFYA